ncbi:phosphoribosyltransferase [Taibaiella lutea]|uniref:Phosphoribosyltransferase n=1 Tax=Taibaiella lutea TaxID=2608001 RepID=A0A5M6CMZ4_9BACT|nr:phosphoribosyltransferase family protein [Taibaiella lutea]KAA5536581.1 phosphoribosyltransferase [Taibaiella lutea]
MNKIAILSAAQIEQKLRRMAFEIWEKNHEEKEIFIIGIEETGAAVASKIAQILKEISSLKVNLSSIKINKKSPLSDSIELEKIELNKKTVILVDDVANSGKTLLYALKPLMDFEPTKIQVAVLVDRKHKNFPVTPDIIGHSVATTIQENIIVNYKNGVFTGAHLE